MLLKQKQSQYVIEKGNAKYSFLESGDVYQWKQGDMLVNQMRGHPLEGSINNIYLRIYQEDKMLVYPLLGVQSESAVSFNSEGVCYKGEVANIKYQVIFQLMNEQLYTYKIQLEGQAEYDVVYGQDVSLAHIDATLSNELYVSQYIDHKILKGDQGYVVSSRQNQRQNPGFPYLQIGSLDGEIISYCTDGMQFFQKQYKKTNKPAIYFEDLPKDKYQYELAYIGLQTRKYKISKQAQICFYGYYQDNHEDAVNLLEYQKEIQNAYQQSKVLSFENFYKVKRKNIKTHCSDKFSQEEIEGLYPQRILEEERDGQLLSFFDKKHQHIVLQEKELLSERNHGHIVMSKMNLEKIDRNIIASTNYMFGVFNSHVVVGNTNLNKLTSGSRSVLNIMKNSGQRLYIKDAGEYHLLTLPGIYEMGISHAKWLYKYKDDILEITSFVAYDYQDIIFNVHSQKGIQYSFIMTQQLVMGSNEFVETIELQKEKTSLILKPQDGSFLKNTYPSMFYRMSISQAKYTLLDDGVFYEDGKFRDETLLTLAIETTSDFQFVIEGVLENENPHTLEYQLEEEKAKFEKYYQELNCHFEMTLGHESRYDVERLNELMWWYTHNALMHYASPHGLEQAGGAAWGTRDVCQGPFEYFMAMQKFGLCREIILETFAHQFKESGEWPQWFMFDKYQMQQDDSHGDIVFWPLKILADYLLITKDYSILQQKVKYCYLNNETQQSEDNLIGHINEAIRSIKERFMFGGYMITYAGGDWDDTLQPANEELQKTLVSAWTMALAYQTFDTLAKAFIEHDGKLAQECRKIAGGVEKEFHGKLIKDNVIAGFVNYPSVNHMEYMLHPLDENTGIHYRLIPMTRSIIGELVDYKQAMQNVKCIHENLECKDGVRLMNKPANYRGGVITYFKRAEQASNVGREIGLQYVHAHIRYLEAMAKLGLKEDLWKSLYRIVPMKLNDYVENANIRQSNCYFSSTEGAFKDRYDYQDHFDKLKTGDIEVKGGWRIYSSGAGIFVRQFISHALGLSTDNEHINIDPVLLKEWDGLKISYDCFQTPVTFEYHIKDKGENIQTIYVNKTEVFGKPLANRYRSAGVSLKWDNLKKLIKDKNTIQIYMD